MRLLNVNTFKIEEFFDDEIPPYAILSHTWEDNEKTFADYQGPSGPAYRPGSSTKIDGCCNETLRRKFEHVWIDTICIDKSSSAELSEALNSMYEWYQNAHTCLVYLADVHGAPPNSRKLDDWDDAEFRKSRWFTRGWTLQELVAPSVVVFYSSSWRFFCKRNGPVFPRRSENLTPIDVVPQRFEDLISEITGIERRWLRGDSRTVRLAPVAQKMSWASGRVTKRREDRAYSLLGLFGVNMPMLYGEGDRAFQRLLKEIISISDDETVFAGGFGLPLSNAHSVLALSPDRFSKSESRRLISRSATRSSHYAVTNKGIHLQTCIAKPFALHDTHFARLNVIVQQPLLPQSFTLAIPLLPTNHPDVYASPRSSAPTTVPSSFFDNLEPKSLYIRAAGDVRVMRHSSGLYFNLNEIPEVVETMEIYPTRWNLAFAPTPLWRSWMKDSAIENEELIYARFSCTGSGREFALRMRLDYTGSTDKELEPPNKLNRTKAAPIRVENLRVEVWVASLTPGTSLLDHVYRPRVEWAKTLDWGDSDLVQEVAKSKAWLASHNLISLRQVRK